MKVTRLLYWIPPVVWMGIIFISSSTPYEEQDLRPLISDKLDLSVLEPFLSPIRFTYNHSEVSVAAQGIAGFIEFFIRKGAHVGVFLVLSLLFYYSASHTIKTSMRWKIIISWGLAVLYAAIDEIHQGFTPNRTPFAGDVVLDTVGITLAMIGIWMWTRRRAMSKTTVAENQN
ncbi:VanZ family protein [Bacillaceae bacterium S4-13-58]